MGQTQSQLATPPSEPKPRLAQLRAAATLQQKKQLLKDNNIEQACATNWLEPAAVREEFERALESDEIPVLDVIMQTPIARDDVVVLSDGYCYSKSSMASLVDSAPIDTKTGRHKLPISGLPMENDDYRSVGRKPLTKESKEYDLARARSMQVIVDSYRESSTDDNASEQEFLFRLNNWMFGDGRPRSEFGRVLGERDDTQNFRKLLYDLPDSTSRLHALRYFLANNPNPRAVLQQLLPILYNLGSEIIKEIPYLLQFSLFAYVMYATWNDPLSTAQAIDAVGSYAGQLAGFGVTV